MGYHTTYELKWKPTENCKLDLETLDDKVGDYIEDESNGMDFALEADGSTGNDATWCEHDETMVRMSKEFPDVLFHLTGEGEERDDIWDSFYLNGKFQSWDAAKLTVEHVEEPDPDAWETPKE